jgi:hypothetical protein
MAGGVGAVAARMADLEARMADLEARIAALTGWIPGMGLGSRAPELPDVVLAALPPTSRAGVGGPFSLPADVSVSVGDQAGEGTSGSSRAVVDPLPGGRLTQPFGPSDLAQEPPMTVDGVRYPHFHSGIDLAAPLGTPVRALAAGTVVSAGRAPDGAVVVVIRHHDGTESRYAHLAPDLVVAPGQVVAAGEVIGRVGMTGVTTGPHLHLELWRGGLPLDPAPVLAAGVLPGTPAGPAEASAVLAAFDRVAGEIPFAAAIRQAALEAGVDPLLLAALVRTESGFRPHARSSAGALGLTQLMPSTARALGVEDPLDPAENLAGGARYLAEDLRRYGRVDRALAAYQAGKGSVARAGGIPPSPTTRHYIDRIVSTWAGYLEAAGLGGRP